MNTSKQILSIAVVLCLATFASSLLVLKSGLQAGFFGLAAIFCMAVAYKYPRLGLWIFLIYLPFSGTISYSIANIYRAVDNKVTYTIDYALFHLAKDFVYFPALIGAIASSQALQKLHFIAKPLIWAISIFFGACLLTLLFVNLPQQLQVPQSFSLLAGLISIKILVGYIPLLICGYYLIGNLKNLYWLNRLFIIISLICCVLCFIQYYLLVQGICPGNSSLGDAAATRATLLARCFVGGSLLYNPERGLIRLPGTFVAPWQWAWFLIANSFFVYGASLSDPSRRWRSLGWLGLGIILATTIITGQRVALLCVPIILLVLFALTESNKKQFFFKLGIIILLGALIIDNIEIVREQINALIGRWNYSPPHKFVFEQLQWVLEKQDGWLGYGLGRATNSARRLGTTLLIETFYAKLLYEIGWLGFLAFLSVISWLVFLTFKAYRSLQKPSLRRLALCWWVFILFLGYNTYYYPLTVDPVAVYYWFIGGVMLKLPELEKKALGTRL
jgi:hypothetical protein